MIVATGPTQQSGIGAFASTTLLLSVLDAPFLIMDSTPAGLSPREVEPGVPFLEPIPVPLLPGMDEIEVESASLAVAGGLTDRQVSGSPGSGRVDLRLQQPAGTSGALSRVEFKGFRLSESGKVLGNSASHVAFRDAGGETTAGPVPTGVGNVFLHVLAQPLEGNSAGPPVAAAPEFAMPGGGRMGYGPALGGAFLDLGAPTGGSLPVTASFSPLLAGRNFRLSLGVAGTGTTATSGLPNEAVPFAGWQASEVIAVFRTRPEDVEFSLTAPGATPAVVASYPGELPAARSDTDLTPAFRAAAKAALANAQGDDLGIQLSIASPTGGKVLLALPRPVLRYIRRPLAGPEPLDLSAGFAELAFDLPVGLRPIGLSFAIDGRYGSARPLDAVRFPAGIPRAGYRLVPGRRIAIPFTFTQAEQLLPLSRLGAFGRSEGEGELLVSLYGGNNRAPAARYGAPVSIPLHADLDMTWHGAAWTGAPPPPPPHAERLWMVLEAAHGAFLLAIEPGALPHGALLSEDNGGAWSETIAAPLVGAWVDEIDPVTSEPAPLRALDLHGPAGLLNGDLVDVVGKHRPAAFSLRWVALAPTHTALMTQIAEADGPFSLRFACRRDVRLTVSDALLIYDPWSARS
jgi:hypothetical protein